MKKLVSHTFNILYKIFNAFWVCYIIAILYISFLFFYIFAGFLELLKDHNPIAKVLTPFFMMPKGLAIFGGVVVFNLFINRKIGRIKAGKNNEPDYIRILILTGLAIVLFIYFKAILWLDKP